MNMPGRFLGWVLGVMLSAGALGVQAEEVSDLSEIPVDDNGRPWAVAMPSFTPPERLTHPGPGSTR